MRKFILAITFLWCSGAIFAQTGGKQVYSFLNQTNIGARTAAMGGDFLSIRDDDISLALANPSLITEQMSNHLNVNIVDYFHSMAYGYVSYGRSLKKYGNFVASLQYLNYGSFDGADVSGEETGKFYANDLALNVGWAKPLSEHFSLGANVKLISSFYERYSSYGAGVDVAATYHNAEKRLASTFMIKNLGRSFKAYESGTDWLPFEIQWGIAKRLEHLPFTYSILVNDLQQWNLRYASEDAVRIDPLTGDSIVPNPIGVFVDNLARHFVVGGELQIHKNFAIRLGYNYKRRQEMKLQSRRSLIGFSWGFEFRIKKIRFAYARSANHLAGAPNFLSISTNLSDMFYRASKPEKE